jgi:1-acyl-sn-glycerol-3-phosphate acyltransferase
VDAGPSDAEPGTGSGTAPHVGTDPGSAPGSAPDPAPGSAPGSGSGTRAPAARRRPVVRARTAASRRTPGGERLVAVNDTEVTGPGPTTSPADDVPASASGDEPPVDPRIAAILRFLRRRLTGDYRVDDFGFDADLTDNVLLNLLRPLYRHWFRVQVRGTENLPDTGGALLVANHGGAVALDSLMTQVAIHDEHPAHRHLRPLGADLVFSTPVIGELARKGGSTLANTGDAERLLSAGELVGVWPEGFKGIGKPFSERYKLQRFGRGGFVSAALRTRTPIIPCAIVGAEETYPIIGDMPALARAFGLPFAPITPTWPLLGPLGLVPLPSKWLIEFGTPIATDDVAPGAADDPMVVFDLTDQVRQTIQQTLYSLLVQRRSVFF